MVLVGIFVLSCICSSSAEPESTTFRTFTLDVPRSGTVKIIEGDPLWEERKYAPDSSQRYRKWVTTSSNANLNNPPLIDNEEGNNSKLTQSSLRDFLNSYTEKVKQNEVGNKQNNADGATETAGGKDKKSWDLLKTHNHNHPYDDKSGWVSLDPVPWSISKISKWHSRPKPTEIPWNDHSSTNRPWMNGYESDVPLQNSYKYKSHSDRNKYQVYYVDEKDFDRSQYLRPPHIYGQSVHMQVTPSILQSPSRPLSINQKYGNHDQIETGDIITDGQPSNFPVKYMGTNRRFGTDLHSGEQPFLKDGEWVLLSTSKGIKYPKKERSLTLNPVSMGTHKSVHLTVLPPLKGSNVNMTTSHGGLLQVESTFETVEESQKKSQMKKHHIKKRKRPSGLVKRRRKQHATKNTSDSVIASVPRSTGVTENDSSALLAGVGAGLIPATMAMFVPIAMNGGRKRRRRNAVSISLGQFQSPLHS